MSDFDGRLDEILSNLTAHAGKNNEKSRNWIYALSKGVYVDEDLRTEAKQAIRSLILAEVIGADRESSHRSWDCACGVTHSLSEDFDTENKLRAEQRKTVLGDKS